MQQNIPGSYSQSAPNPPTSTFSARIRLSDNQKRAENGGETRKRMPARSGRRRERVEVPCDPTDVAAWFAGRLPDGWFEGAVEVSVDRDEILVIGSLAPPRDAPEGADAAKVAQASRIEGFREETRGARMAIAEAGQHKWQRIVSWGARCGDTDEVFTNASVPVMTRLRLADRQVLDTLIDAGVARSRSEAMAWCVQQVGLNQSEWIDRLRDAMTEVERIRSEGPGA